jgi:hypothetical protein
VKSSALFWATNTSESVTSTAARQGGFVVRNFLREQPRSVGVDQDAVIATEIMKVIAGIDTHADTHHVAIINEHGKRLADKEFLAIGSGCRKIVDFITGYGSVSAVDIEGTAWVRSRVSASPHGSS